MTKHPDPFAPLLDAIDRKNRESGFDESHPWRHRLTISESEGLLDVEYRGEYELWFDDAPSVSLLADLLRVLASPAVAARLRSFVFRTEAVLAANGT